MILTNFAPMSISRLAVGHADWTIFTFALATAMVNGILCGILPALHAIRKRDISTCGLAVRDGTSRESNRTRRNLIVAEIALSVPLVVVGGQLLGNFIEMVRGG